MASGKYQYRTQMGTSYGQSCFIGQDREIWGQHDRPMPNGKAEPAAASAGGLAEAPLLLGMDVHAVPVRRAVSTIHELVNSGKLSGTGLPSRL